MMINGINERLTERMDKRQYQLQTKDRLGSELNTQINEKWIQF